MKLIRCNNVKFNAIYYLVSFFFLVGRPFQIIFGGNLTIKSRGHNLMIIIGEERLNNTLLLYSVEGVDSDDIVIK